MKKQLSLIAFVMSLAILAGCEDKPQDAPTDTTSSRSETASTTTSSGSAPQSSSTDAETSQYDESLAKEQLGEQAAADDGSVPKGTISVKGRKPKNGEEVAILDTEKGKIVLMFFPDKAPKHVANYKKLIKTGFYNGTKFHRTIPGFMIQGGDPNTKRADRSTWGMGGPDWSVEAEFNDIHHAPGVLSMARSSDPNSAGSQFFIMVADYPSLNHQYTAFGKVVSGQDVVNKIVAGPTEGDIALNPVTIKKATLAKWPVK